MRRKLDRLYRISGACAALCIVMICLLVVLQVGANIIDKAASWLLGQPIGLLIPSYAEFTGFFLAAATFLALAYSFRANAHIRVSLILRNFSHTPRRLMEIWCLGVASSVSGYFTFFTANLVWESYRFGDLAVGMIALPIWVPQSAMLIGLAILTVALIDDFVSTLRYGSWSYQKAEAEENAQFKNSDTPSK